jgi:3-deoxy-D-manno-octulosonic-acid transferase
MLFTVYRNLTNILSLPIFIFFFFRLINKKETKKSFIEKFGFYKLKRPKGKIIWINSVSIGESLSIIPIINKIHSHYPNHNILITTSTVTSKKVIQKLGLKNVIHQFSPLDISYVVKKFFKYWTPDLSIFVESELWPNLIFESKKYTNNTFLINARLSEKTFLRWKRFPNHIKKIFEKFDLCLSQDDVSRKRLEKLGMKDVKNIGNIKFFSDNLSYNYSDFKNIKNQINNRFIILLVSSHEKEEELLLSIKDGLDQSIPNLLIILLPRHINRSLKIQNLIKQKGFDFSTRSKLENISYEKKCYLADTIGEVGLFYKVSDIVIIGGSFVNHGGQNPIEASHFNVPIIFGPYMHNFLEISQALLQNKAALNANKNNLKNKIIKLYSDKQLRLKQSDNLRVYCLNEKKKLKPMWIELDKYISKI